MSCNRCGFCCRAIVLSFDRSELIKKFERDPNNYDFQFVIKHWNPISKERALELNPHLNQWREGIMSKKDIHFYTCDRFDHKTDSCAVHDGGQPWVCSGYPIYKGKFIPANLMFYSPTCGFKDPKYLWETEKPDVVGIYDTSYNVSDWEIQKANGEECED